MQQPYISIIFANRNDNYGGDQKNRIQTFIDYYAHYDQKYPGLFELVVCDWNPPKDRCSLQDAYNWNVFSRVKFVTVPHETHQIYVKDKNFPILDYVARNVSIRHSSAPFVMVLNQDIFLTDSIFTYLSKRKLSSTHFYRADRCDFHFDQITDRVPEHFEAEMKKNVFRRHRRPLRDGADLSPYLTPDELSSYSTSASQDEILDKTDHIIYPRSIRMKRRFNKIFSPLIAGYLLLKKIKNPQTCIDYYYQYNLHTNASGDFIIAPRIAFEKIHGFPETTDFYMHTDSYACFQLCAAGYDQAIFVGPHAVFHADHSRMDRADRIEKITFNEHAYIFSKICCFQENYRLNSSHWGLVNYNLKIEGSI